LAGIHIWKIGGFQAVGIVTGVIMLTSVIVLFLWVKEAEEAESEEV
jgi:Na+/pantothenate symporter